VDFVKLRCNFGLSYSYDGGSRIEMDNLGLFLSCDMRCNVASFREWAEEDSDLGTGGNITWLEKENGYICITDTCSQERVPTEMRMTKQQFLQLLNDWEEKVCKLRPQEVVITYEGGQFSIETSGDANCMA